MKNFKPKRPTGTSDEARFMQWVWDEIMAAKINNSPTVKVNRTPNGQTLDVIQPPPAETGSDDGVWL